MEKNVGGYDRIARFIVGPLLLIVGAAALLELFTIAAGTLGLALAIVALLVGLVLSVTAITQKCPLNNILGLNTYRGKETPETTREGDVGRTA